MAKANKPRKARPRYVELQWTDPTASPDRRFNDGCYRTDVLADVLSGLYMRGITTVATDDVATVRALVPVPEGMTIEALYGGAS